MGLHLGHVMGLLRDGQLGLAPVLRETQASAWVTVTDLAPGMSCLIRGSPGSAAGDDGFCALHCAGSGREDLVQQPLPVLRPMHVSIANHAIATTVHGLAYFSLLESFTALLSPCAWRGS